MIQSQVLFASAARTTAQPGTIQKNKKSLGLIVNINITAYSAGSLTVTIEGIDPLSGQAYTILASAALNATGFTTLRVYPGLVAVANQAISHPLPSQWRVKTAVGGAQSITYSINAEVLD